LAARFANTSSLIPSGALSIAPTFSFFSTGVTAVVAGLAVEAEAEAVALGLDAVEVGFGLNAIPNRSARDFIACCSGVNVFSVVLEASGAGALSVYWSDKGPMKESQNSVQVQSRQEHSLRLQVRPIISSELHTSGKRTSSSSSPCGAIPASSRRLTRSSFLPV